MELTYIEVQDFLDCINEEDFDNMIFQGRINGATFKSVVRPVRRRAAAIKMAKPKTQSDIIADKHADDLFKEMKDGKWQTR